MIREAVLMKFGEVKIPEGLSYTKKHLWLNLEYSICTLGWTDYIQCNAGEVNHIELPQRGTPVALDQEFGSIETSKWVDRLYSPLNGEVMEMNERILDNPVLINEAPFTEGWFIKVEPQGEIDSENLMSPAEYLEYLKECEE